MRGKVGGGKMIEEERPEWQHWLLLEALEVGPMAPAGGGRAVEAVPRADAEVLVGVVAGAEALDPVAFTILTK
jgi:hypothetical protein